MRDRVRFGCAVLLTCGIAVAAAGPAQAKVYWSTNEGKIQRAALDGTRVATLVQLPKSPLANSLVIDPTVGKMFWVESAGPGFVRSANMNGSDVQTIMTRFT